MPFRAASAVVLLLVALATQVEGDVTVRPSLKQSLASLMTSEESPVRPDLDAPDTTRRQPNKIVNVNADAAWQEAVDVSLSELETNLSILHEHLASTDFQVGSVASEVGDVKVEVDSLRSKVTGVYSVESEVETLRNKLTEVEQAAQVMRETSHLSNITQEALDDLHATSEEVQKEIEDWKERASKYSSVVVSGTGSTLRSVGRWIVQTIMLTTVAGWVAYAMLPAILIGMATSYLLYCIFSGRNVVEDLGSRYVSSKLTPSPKQGWTHYSRSSSHRRHR